MACEDVVTRSPSEIQKIQPPALPVAKDNDTVVDKEQSNNILRIFFNRLTDALNKLTDNADDTGDSITSIEGDITDIQGDITTLDGRVTNIEEDLYDYDSTTTTTDSTVNNYSTTNTDNSITITDNSLTFNEGDTVTFNETVYVGGITITEGDTYTVTNVNGDTYTITTDEYATYTTTIEGDTSITYITINNPDDVGDGPTDAERCSVSRAYRYWRIVNADVQLVTGVPGDLRYLALDEIELFEYTCNGEANVAEEATVLTVREFEGGYQSGDTTDNESPIEFINDGFYNQLNRNPHPIFGPRIPNMWYPTTVQDPSFFIQWDFGEGNAKAVVAIKQHYPLYETWGEMLNGSGTLSKFEVQASDGGLDVDGEIIWERTFYVSWEYEDATGLLPVLAKNVFLDSSGHVDHTTGQSEKYWLHPHGKPAAGGGGEYWIFDTTVRANDWTAVAGTFYFCSRDGGALTMTLPASPSDGDRVGVRAIEPSGTAAQISLTVAGNGESVEPHFSAITPDPNIFQRGNPSNYIWAAEWIYLADTANAGADAAWYQYSNTFLLIPPAPA